MYYILELDEQKVGRKNQNPMYFHALKYLHGTSIKFRHCAISARHFPITHPKRVGFSSAGLDSNFFIGIFPRKCFGSIDIVQCAALTAKCEILSRRKESLTIHGRNGSKCLINWRHTEKKYVQKMAICSQSARELSRVSHLFLDQVYDRSQRNDLDRGRACVQTFPNKHKQTVASTSNIRGAVPQFFTCRLEFLAV